MYNIRLDNEVNMIADKKCAFMYCTVSVAFEEDRNFFVDVDWSLYQHFCTKIVSDIIQVSSIVEDDDCADDEGIQIEYNLMYIAIEQFAIDIVSAKLKELNSCAV